MKDNDVNLESGREISITIEEAGHRALKMAGPFLFISLVPFIIIHGWQPFGEISLTGLILFVLTSFIGIVIHELIHAFIFGLFTKGGFKSIRFGIDRKTWSPYCHPAINMKVWIYRTGALAPLVILGITPVVVSLFYASVFWLFFGVVFSIAAGGDIISVWLTRNLSSGDIVRDHTSKLGFYIIDQPKI